MRSPGLPLARHVVLGTSDVDAARASVSASLAPHRLTPAPGPFRAVHHAVDLDAVSLHAIDYGCEVEVAVDGLGFHLVQIPLAGRSTVVTGPDEVTGGPGTAVVAPAGRPLRMRYSAGNPRLMVRVDSRLLEARREVARASGVDVPDRLAVLDLTRGAGRSWRMLLDVLVTDAEHSGPLAGTGPAGSSIRTALVDALLAGTAAPGPEGADGARERVVRRAARLIEDHCAEPLGTVDVAEAVGVSVRALREGFREHLGTSPMAHLRRARLEHVRSDLAAGRSASVTEAALRWGIGHLGRLSLDYRRAFGESPSETLERSR